MNSQHAGYAHQYPPPQTLTYPFPYPAQQVTPQPPQIPPYQYQPPQAPSAAPQGHPVPSYARSFPPTPQPPPARSQAPSQQSLPRSSATRSPPQNDPGAPLPEPPSPDLDSFDQDLMNALQDDHPNEQPDADQPDNNDEDDGPVFHLPPPPETTYASQAELEKAMHAWSLEHGYELVRRAAKKNATGQVYKRYHHCAKHGQKNSTTAVPKQRVRNPRKSNRIGCPMSVAAVAVDPSNSDGQWQIRHRKAHHNHPADAPSALSGHRRRAREGGVEKAVDGLLSIGTPIAQILQFLHNTHPNGIFTRTDVANMKLKWRKYGTSSYKPGEGEESRGRGEACQACRAKKRGCGGQRPTCTSCQAKGIECKYTKELPDDDDDAAGGAEDDPMDLTTPTPAPQNQSANATSLATPARSLQPARGVRAWQAAQTKEILNELRDFQAEHITRERLSLQHSSVESLALNQCGAGESYNRLPVLSRSTDWPQFKDAAIEAAMRENTYDVLIGAKIEPQKPTELLDDKGQVELDVWNEYIKQLAIYNKRNSALVAALRSHLAPNMQNRVQGYVHASLIWQALEDLCLPRGSETAWKLYTDVHDITLSNSADLKDYIYRITSKYAQFKQLKLNTTPQANGWRPRGQGAANASAAQSGEEALPEEMVCFLFLKNLGQSWRH